jgi:uncharacterized integral membrane protein
MKALSQKEVSGKRKREKVAMTVLIGALITIIIAIIKF